ncbi:sensor histidine kinase [Chitinophaga sancti]|uniref:sensor histidine kinase n=1 Tax=Chitinophaga sancti TaxID=1004 RepID=UPI003F793DFA
MILLQNNTVRTSPADLETMHRFMGMLAHEMRTQIAGICTASKMLLNEKDSRKDTDFYLSHINSMGINVLHVLNNMMATSNIQDGKLAIKMLSKRIHLRQWFKDQLQHYKVITATRSVKIKTNFRRTVPEYIITDEIKLGQIIKNLIDNALKYAPSGTDISIQISSLGEFRLLFQISDHGEGIPSDKIPFLFEPFQSIDEGLGGMGLGLYVSKLYAVSLGGDLILANNDSKGTTFLILINNQLQPNSIPNNLIH